MATTHNNNLSAGDHITADPHEAAPSDGESKQIYSEDYD